MVSFDMLLGFEDVSYPTKDYIKKRSRDIKLALLLNNNSIKINNSENETLDFIINSNLDKYIITGSFALKLYGLLDRKSKDLDLVTNSADRKYKTKNNYTIETKGRLGFVTIKERLRFNNIFNRKKYECDFFLDDNPKFRTFQYKGFNLKIQEPLTIVDEKLRIVNSIINSSIRNWDNLGLRKHLRDFDSIEKRVEEIK